MNWLHLVLNYSRFSTNGILIVSLKKFHEKYFGND